jgi:hypothetical protein
MLAGMDRQLAGFKDECNALAEQHQAWLAETVQTNTKRLQYQTCAGLGKGGRAGFAPRTAASPAG